MAINHDISLDEAFEMNRCELAELHGLPRSPLWVCPYDLDVCDDPECYICGLVVCDYGEPLHFHHDGCPAAASIDDNCTTFTHY